MSTSRRSSPGRSWNARHESSARVGRPVRCAAIHSIRRAISAPAGTASTSTDADPSGGLILEGLRDGDLEVLGRLPGSSNQALVVLVHHPDLAEPFHAVYKATVAERPLFDFPEGTLTRREVAAFVVSEALGWRIVPPTVLAGGPIRRRDGPGMDPRRPCGRCGRDDRRAGCPRRSPPPDGDLRRDREQHRPEGRARVARSRWPRVRRGPRGDVLDRAEAPDRPLGLDGRATSGGRAGGDHAGPGSPVRRAWRHACGSCSPGPR